MIKRQAESRLIGELREHLREVQQSTADLVRQQSDVRKELSRALQIVLELPQPKAALRPETVPSSVSSSAASAADPPAEGWRIARLRQQLQDVHDFADDLAKRQSDLNMKLKSAVQEALDLRHCEVEGRTELGGEA